MLVIRQPVISPTKTLPKTEMPRILYKLTALPVVVTCLTALGAEANFIADVSYDAAVPTQKEVVAHAWGEDLTAHHEMERYLEAPAASTPRLRLVEYGRSWENRKLYYVVIASEAHQRQLDEIRAGLQRLADPRESTRAEFERLVAALPVVVWLSHGVHGNESSTTETALLTAYHLLAARHDRLVDATLDRAIAILDPLQNPDGRERFVQYWRQTRGRTPDAEPQAAEHREPWPGGRGNHYLFDLNRDWFALTQPETRAKVAVLRRWCPQVIVDLHEMGRNQTYFFPPAAKPLNPYLPSDYVSWTARFGKNAAAWLDRNRVNYFTREGFDAFYPGYADTWSSLRGAIGLTLEQASVRGLARRRDDVDLIAARCEKKPTGTTQKPQKVEANELAETPGAILRVKLDVEHWLAYGCRRVVHVPVDGNRIFCPLQRDQGDNVGQYVSQDRLLASGFMWDETRKRTAHQAYFLHQSRGRGHVVAFAEDPNFRGLCDGLHLLLFNAVFFGPAH